MLVIALPFGIDVTLGAKATLQTTISVGGRVNEIVFPFPPDITIGDVDRFLGRVGRVAVQHAAHQLLQKSKVFMSFLLGNIVEWVRRNWQGSKGP